MSDAAVTAAPAIKEKISRDDWIMRGCMVVIGIFLLFFIVLPLYTLMSKSFENRSGDFVGLANYFEYFSTPALFLSAVNSLYISVIGTFVVLGTAFVYAYALTRTCMPFKWFFKLVAVIPLLTPSLLAGISLVYWFGRQGVARGLLMGESIYGPIGIIIGSSYWVFPHALMIVITALSITDARLYEAAVSLRASKVKTFLTVTIPGCKYGLISTGFVVFTLIFTDFGVPKVIGGNFNMLATDIYKQVIGQQNFQMGAVVSIILLVPAAPKAGFDQVQAPFVLSEPLRGIGEPDYAIVCDIQVIDEYHSPAIDRVGQNFYFRGRRNTQQAARRIGHDQVVLVIELHTQRPATGIDPIIDNRAIGQEPHDAAILQTRIQEAARAQRNILGSFTQAGRQANHACQGVVAAESAGHPGIGIRLPARWRNRNR